MKIAGRFQALLILAGSLALPVGPACADSNIYVGVDGLLRVAPYPVAAQYLNDPWPADWESN